MFPLGLLRRLRQRKQVLYEMLYNNAFGDLTVRLTSSRSTRGNMNENEKIKKKGIEWRECKGISLFSIFGQGGGQRGFFSIFLLV